MRTRVKNNVITVVNTIIVFCCANCFYPLKTQNLTILVLLAFALTIFSNILPYFFCDGFPSAKLRLLNHGVLCLKTHLISTIISSLFHIYLAFVLITDNLTDFLVSGVICIIIEALLFWNGIFFTHFNSHQISLKQKIVGIILSMIPVVNLFSIYNLIKITSNEVYFETDKTLLNNSRVKKKVCSTKYPILLVHGVFFRDSAFLNYWGRIPEELEKNGAKVFYGNNQSAVSIPDSAAEINERIREIIESKNCKKVNIIAHSKGGLDCRYAASILGASPFIASITTINTPHKGCEFADYLLLKIPKSIQNKIAFTYNTALKHLGDTNPDFMQAVSDLTARGTQKLMAEVGELDGIYCQSFGSKLNRASGGRFPLNFSYRLVKRFDGPNDGLVAAKSFEWGENYRFITIDGKKGISHGDMIDINKKNIKNFDVRELYVDIVSDLKARGF